MIYETTNFNGKVSVIDIPESPLKSLLNIQNGFIPLEFLVSGGGGDFGK